MGERLLLLLRRSPRTLAWALTATNVLNLLDLFLTANVLVWGGSEANPVMRWLFQSSPVGAAVFKVTVVLAATLLVWRLRRFRAALLGAVVLTAVFLLVTVYHLLGIGMATWHW